MTLASARAPAAAVPAPPDHVVQLPGLAGWTAWRWVALRSAGFPAAGIDVLHRPECARASDALLAAEDERLACAADALAAVDSALDGLRASGAWAGSERRPLLDARGDLRAGRLPRRLPADLDLASLVAAERDEREARQAYERGYRQAVAETSAVVAELARDDRLCEAILWQNRGAYLTAVRPLRRGTAAGDRNNELRQREELVVRYFQRYSVKNDTIGFFGPFGWARFVDDGEPLSARLGEVAGKRMLFFEQWAVDALADTLAAQPALDPWVAPRRLPFAHLDGTTLYPIEGPPLSLSPAQAALLRACDGGLPAHRIAAEIVALGLPELATAEQVYACLDDLRTRGLIVWRLETPYVARPERALRRALEGIGDPQLRATTLRTLDLFDAARDGVARAAGTVEELDHALGVMDQVFERVTGQPPVRGRGRMNVGRAVLYEDCVRDVDLELGPALLAELGPPVTLILQSARWLTREISGRYRAGLHALYKQLESGQGPRVRFADLWPLLPDHFAFLREEAPADSAVLAEMKGELQRRWIEVLGLGDPARPEHRVSTASLLEPVREAFPAEAPGWELARYMSVDVFLAAEDVAAVGDGDYSFVLGEIHLANNTVGASDFVEAHPEPAVLRSYPDHDLPRPCVLSVPSRRWRGMSSRTRGTLTRQGDYFVLISHEFPSEPVDPARRLAIAELVVEPEDGELVVRTYDGRFRREIVEFFGELISISVVDAFRFFSDLPHVPRISVDRLVVQRESWSFPAAELGFATRPTGAERLHEARRLARRHGLPDAVFVALPLEQKPIYVDFSSPILVEILARMIRRALDAGAANARIVFSEILPALDRLWLADPNDNRYTSEFRIVTVDRG